MKRIFGLLFLVTACLYHQVSAQSVHRSDFDRGWKFHPGDEPQASRADFDDAGWRSLNLPHDWSIEGAFSPDNPAGVGGGALPGGVGWYRKSFSLPREARGKSIYIGFDGVYCHSEVWINGHYLGKRPNGYISFQYDISPFVHVGEAPNRIAVRVDNSRQPNSRWYSGSGIYRNVWLTVTGPVHVAYQGTQVQADPSGAGAKIHLRTLVENAGSKAEKISVETRILDRKGVEVGRTVSRIDAKAGDSSMVSQELRLPAAHRWSVDDPYLYAAETRIMVQGREVDQYRTSFGIRSFNFDYQKGFFLNGEKLKIRGVCNHHGLGSLGAAVNTRALERQIEMLKAMGCNAIRTSHNPPAPELLDLCDRMGMLVMDEAFDMWATPKNKYDYHLYWDEWHARDLADQVRRDRNHPSVIMWSVGNEIPEQRMDDGSGARIVKELTAIVKSLDSTRPVLTANDEVSSRNQILKAGVEDIIGFNYHHQNWTPELFETWGRKPFIVTESVSALETRGHYDMPADSIRRWPRRWDIPLTEGNPDFTVSAYDNVSAPWGSTHEETMRVFEKNDFVSGMFIWTGFDYLGEPTPYSWPARSSYFGIIDLAGFPKDVYYMYQSEWTDHPVLHLFPHWNWKPGDTVDVWAYYNQADAVELFLNGQSLGLRKKDDSSYHVSWHVPFQPGTLKAVALRDGKAVRETSVHTADTASKLVLKADRNTIRSDGKDLTFVTVRVTDSRGNLVPDAHPDIRFSVEGSGELIAVDNGSETSHESFKARHHHAFNGLCLAVLQSTGGKKPITLKAASPGLGSSSVVISLEAH